MFFKEHEKQIYRPENSTRQYDPLALDRAITIASEGNFATIWNDWVIKAGDSTLEKTVTAEEASLISAKAEAELAQIARKVFGLPAFPECLDAVALDMLIHFQDWMQKKSRQDGMPQSS